MVKWTDSQLEVALRVIEQEHTPCVMRRAPGVTQLRSAGAFFIADDTSIKTSGISKPIPDWNEFVGHWRDRQWIRNYLANFDSDLDGDTGRQKDPETKRRDDE